MVITETICRIFGHRWERTPWSVHKLTGGRTAKVHRCGRCLDMNKTVIEG